MPPNAATEIITAAIEGFESQKPWIDEEISELHVMLSGTQPKAAVASQNGTRRKMSVAARKRMAPAQRKRCTAARKASTPATPQASRSKRR